MASVAKRPNGRWRLRYRDLNGREHSQDYALRRDANSERARIELAISRGEDVDGRARKTTMREWTKKWFDSYNGRPSTRRQASTHLKIINSHFSERRLSAIRPTEVREWIGALQEEGRSAGYVYALHSRLRQVMQDAVHDRLIDANPCSRRTAPPMAKQRPYVATTKQVWQLYAAMPEGVRAAVLLGGFVGLRVSEASGVDRGGMDRARGVISPAVQWGGAPLKTEESQTDIPVPVELCELIAADMLDEQSHLLRNHWGKPAAPWVIERHFNEARAKVDGLPENIRFHDLRHHYASLLIHSGLSVKEVQARLRHGSAKTTLDVYAHLWPDTADASRSAIQGALGVREDILRAA